MTGADAPEDLHPPNQTGGLTAPKPTQTKTDSMKSRILLLLTVSAVLGIASCTLTEEQKARLQLAEKQAAGVGDKILRIGVFIGEITPEEAAAARALGNIIVTPEPVPTTSAKNPILVTSGK